MIFLSVIGTKASNARLCTFVKVQIESFGMEVGSCSVMLILSESFRFWVVAESQ